MKTKAYIFLLLSIAACVPLKADKEDELKARIAVVDRQIEEIKTRNITENAKKFLTELYTSIRSYNIGTITDFVRIEDSYLEMVNDGYWQAVSGNATKETRDRVSAFSARSNSLKSNLELLRKARTAHYLKYNLTWEKMDPGSLSRQVKFESLADTGTKIARIGEILTTDKFLIYSEKDQGTLLSQFSTHLSQFETQYTELLAVSQDLQKRVDSKLSK